MWVEQGMPITASGLITFLARTLPSTRRPKWWKLWRLVGQASPPPLLIHYRCCKWNPYLERSSCGIRWHTGVHGVIPIAQYVNVFLDFLGRGKSRRCYGPVQPWPCPIGFTTTKFPIHNVNIVDAERNTPMSSMLHNYALKYPPHLFFVDLHHNCPKSTKFDMDLWVYRVITSRPCSCKLILKNSRSTYKRETYIRSP